MYHLHARIVIDAPIEAVFRVVSDHESFLSGLGGTCRLIREGSPERNGLGAIREVRSGALTFSEEIVSFDPPRRFDYLVTQIVGKRGRPLPFKHKGGRLVLESIGAKTTVDWDSPFSIPLPLVGWLLERIAARKMAPIFRQMLQRAKSQLEAPPSGAKQTIGSAER